MSRPILILTASLLLNVLAGIYSCNGNPVKEQSTSRDTTSSGKGQDKNQVKKETDQVKTTKDSISIIGVGDMMLGTNYPHTGYLPPEDGKNILAPVKDILIGADLTFGNLEGGFLTGSGPAKACSNPSVCYAFKMPDHYVQYFKEAGFDLLSIANNHIYDFGEKGASNTISVLDKEGIKYAGLSKCPFTTFDKDGVKYGFAAFAPNRGTVNINDYANARSIVKKLDSLCDIVIVSFHGGAEGAGKTHITRSHEIFLGENRGNPYEFARIVIDAGADIVFGHGPHVTRAVDIYKNRFIAYSMGNFATYGRFGLSGACGLAPILKITVNGEGEFIRGYAYSIAQRGEGGPVIDPDNNAVLELKKLTEKDIPESGIQVNMDGSISKK